MKKIIGLLLLAIVSLNAGTVGENTKDPRVFGKLFFDYTINGESFFEYITVGSRKYMLLDPRVVKHLQTTHTQHPFTIKGRIEVPEHMQGSKVMVKTPVYEKAFNDYYKGNKVGYLYLGNKKITSELNSEKVLSDSVGNRYIDFEIRGYSLGNYVAKYLVPNLPKFTVSIAPAQKKRGQDFAWEKAKFYVVEE